MNEQERQDEIIRKIEEAKKELQSITDPECEKLTKFVTSQLLEIIADQTAQFIQSIEERKKVENELRLFSRATDQSASSIVITNLAGTIIYVNQKFCQVTGYSKEEAIGQNPRILKSGEQDEEFYKDMWNTIKSGREWSGEFHNKRKDGKLYWEYATISPIKDDKGNITHYMAVKEDITEKKEAEEALEKSRKMLREEIAVKNKFFSIISHDLRSPFTALLGYAEMLEEDYDELTEEEKREYIHSLRQTAANTFELLESLLKWARAQTDKLEFNPENLDIFELAIETTALFASNAKNKQIELISSVPPNTIVFGDKEMLRTILRNFVSNAIKFTPKGGKVEIKYNCDEKYHTISISDTGVGLSQEAIEKIFKLDEHYTTPGTEDESGSGFGLALVYELVRKHRGKISVTSKPGEGSEFSFQLPKDLKEILEKEKKEKDEE